MTQPANPRIIVICGPMSGGKSTSLRRYISRAKRAHKQVDVVLHVEDLRSNGRVSTHDGETTDGLGVTHRVVASSRELFDGVPPGTDVVAIEEAQFFDLDLPLYVQKLQDQGIEVVIAGLDQTSEGDPFGSMGHLLTIATTIEKVTAICPCGAEATRTLALKPKVKAVRIGGLKDYRAACHACWRNRGAAWPKT